MVAVYLLQTGCECFGTLARCLEALLRSALLNLHEVLGFAMYQDDQSDDAGWDFVCALRTRIHKQPPVVLSSHFMQDIICSPKAHT
jgi:hypothetical protein